MTNVIKVAKAGYNVLTDADINNFIFDSSVNTFKILAEGSLLSQTISSDPTTLTVAHGQSVNPAIYALAKFPDGYLALPAQTDHIFTVYGSRHWLVNIDATNISFVFYKGGTVLSDTGAANGSTAANDAGNGGTISWANWNDGLSSNNVYATATFTGAAISKYLKITNFGFNVPTDATVTGVVLDKEGHVDGTLGGASRSRLVIADSPTGSIKDGNFPGVDTVITHGDLNDPWGNTLTPTIVNSSLFGAALWTEIVSGSGTVYIDSLSLTVHYNQNGGNYSVSVKYYIFETPGT